MEYVTGKNASAVKNSKSTESEQGHSEEKNLSVQSWSMAPVENSANVEHGSSGNGKMRCEILVKSADRALL